MMKTAKLVEHLSHQISDFGDGYGRSKKSIDNARMKEGGRTGDRLPW